MAARHRSDGRDVPLTVPPDELARTTAITATPVAAATGLPLNRVVAGVQFAPDGLELPGGATLTITLPGGILPPGLVGFTVQDDGTGFETLPIRVVDGVATVHVTHFSTAGFGQSPCGPTALETPQYEGSWRRAS